MIKDVELRFVERSVPVDEHVARTVRILQSRKLFEHREVAGYGRTGVWDEWTEWADVPLATQTGGSHAE